MTHYDALTHLHLNVCWYRSTGAAPSRWNKPYCQPDRRHLGGYNVKKNVPIEKLWQINSPVFVREVHPQDDVLLCVLMAAGVDDHHVANPFGPSALQAHGLREPIHISSGTWATTDCRGRQFDGVCGVPLTSLMRSSDRRTLNMICRC